MEDLTNMTSKLGGHSDTLTGITLALGQSWGKAKLMAQDTNQMIERGVPVWDLLVKVTGKTTSELTKMMEAGELGRPVIEKLIRAMGEESVGASSRAMATLGGQVNMLGDAWHKFEDALLQDKTEGLLKRIVTGWTLIFESVAQTLNKPIDDKIADLDEKLKKRQTSPFISGLASVQNSLGLGNTESELIAQRDALIKSKSVAAIEMKQANEAAERNKKAQQMANDTAKAKSLEIEKIHEFGTAQQKENIALDEAREKYGTLTQAMREQIHAKEFSKEISAANRSAHKEESEAHKAATEAAREAKKEQEGYKKLIESTPIGEYNAKMSELNNALQKGGIDQQTYNELMGEAAAKYEKGTVGIDKMTAAEKERQRVFDNTARGKFEKSSDELRLGKGSMSELEYANKQDKIGVDYLHESGLNKDAKTKIDAATEATKAFEEATKKASKATFDLGSQGSMAFDGLLGGISAMTGAFENMSDTLSKHKSTFDEIGATYSKNMQMEGMTTEQRATLTKQYYDDKKQYEAANLNSSLAGMRQIVGATSKMFSENSSARKAMHAVEMTLSVIEIAMTLKKTVAKVAEGASTMFAQSGWAGFAGVAAMAAVMAGLGFAMAGGGSKEAVLPEHIKTTGTVLGDSEAQSHSINNIVSKLDEIHAREYPELRNIADSMNELKTSISSMIASIFKMGGVKMATPIQLNNDNSAKMMALSGVTALASGVSAGLGVAGAVSGLVGSGMATGIGLALGAATAGVGLVVSAAIWALSKVPVIGDIINGITSFISNGLFGKKTATVKDGGININAQSMGSVIDSGSIDGAVSTIIDTKKSSWFSTSHKISEILTALDDGVKYGLGKVFSSMAVAVGTFWDFIGGDVKKGLDKIRSFTIPFANIKTFGLKEADIQKAFEDYSSMTFDNLVKHVFGGFVTQFQAMGESLTDTMNRLITDTVQVKTAFTKMGANMSQTNDHLIIFSESMIGMAGGLKNLIALTDNFTNKFTSKEVKNKMSVDDIKAFASNTANQEALKSQGLDMTVIDKVLAAIDDKGITAADVTALKDSIGSLGSTLATKASEASAKSDKYSLPDAAAAYEKAFNYVTATKFTGNAAWNEIVGGKDYSKVASEDFHDYNAGKKANLTAAQWLAVAMKDPEFKRTILSNDAQKSQGMAELAALGLPTDEKTYNTNKAAEAAIAKPIESLTVSALELTDALGTVTDNLANYAKIVEATANITKTAGENIDATRANDIAGLSTQNEKEAKLAYYTTLDTKKWLDDTLAGEQRIYDLRHTAAEVSIAVLNRNIEKIKNEATATDKLNGYTQQRINLLKQEFVVSQFSAYDKKLVELRTSITSLNFTSTESEIANVKKGIDDLVATFPEITDADTDKVVNPIKALIKLLIDSASGTSIKEAARTLTDFRKSISNWVTGMKTTSLGNSESRMNAAQEDFTKKYDIVTDKTDKYSNVEKSEAMSGMTGAADKLIGAIHDWGANGDKAQALISGADGVMAKMESLPDVASMQALTFDALKESNGLLESIKDATNATADALGKPVVSNTRAMTEAEMTDYLANIGKSAANTQTTYESVDKFKNAESILGTKIDNIKVDFSEIKTAPITIEPISLSLDTSGISSILNSQLVVLSDIRTALNKGIPSSGGGSGVTNNGANSGNNNVINLSIGGGEFGAGTVIPSIAGAIGNAANDSPVKPFFGDGSGNTPPPGSVTTKPFFSANAPGIETYFEPGALKKSYILPSEENIAFYKYTSAHPEITDELEKGVAFNAEIDAYKQKLATEGKRR
jgi:tape measure domain-containing protein